MSTQSESSSSISSGWKYDIFLSFRGEDTRNNFTSHLYAALSREGIYVFRDDKELERGNSIPPKLFKAIEESRFSIIVFSKNYAYSTWCLDELIKIVECKNANDPQTVFPIFYDVEPTVVRKQKENFQEAFAKHEEAFKENRQKVQKWRDALKEVANISGWELKDKNESEFIEDVVKKISNKLIPQKFESHKELVGIESRLTELLGLLETGSNDVRMIGIWGKGGLGKTTIAQVVYDQISWQFEGSCFLGNVRETCKILNGLISLQQQLLLKLLKLTDNCIQTVSEGINQIGCRLRRKKVLLVIDDVDDAKQLESLAGKHDWFGSGSRIIITSRDKQPLTSHGVDKVYELQELNGNEGHQLFCMKAFKAREPIEDYWDLSEKFVEYAAGLPLALRVLGSSLTGKSVEVWESTLQKVESESTDDILKILQISFDGLEETEKAIFLDIACFFKGMSKDYVTKILDYCEFFAESGISVLVDKSLISVSDYNILCMHDLLQEMGQQIVRRPNPSHPGKHSRLWKKEDIDYVFRTNTGTPVVEAVVLEDSQEESAYLIRASAKAFSKMTGLRLLMIRNVELPEVPECLPHGLRFVDWHGYPAKSLPSNLQLDKAIEFNMCYSRMEQMWKKIKSMEKLKIMRLDHSKNLKKIPNLENVPNLEELILEGCTRLREIHPSLFLHKNLVVLNVKDCTNLMTLPRKISTESLRNLVLSGCSKLRKFPEITGNMECLLELLLDGTAIKELPESVRLLSGLIVLNLGNCKNLKNLPRAIFDGLKCLKTLNLSGCSKLGNLPENLGEVEILEELDISGTAIRQPPLSIFHLTNLKVLSIRGCKGPSTSKSTSWLSLFHINLLARSSNSMVLPSFSGLSSLVKLDLSDCNLGEGVIPNDIWNLLSLEMLNLSNNNFVSLPGTVSPVSNLKKVKLVGCERLECLPKLPSGIAKVGITKTVSSGIFHEEGRLTFDCRNCLKLLGSRDFAFSMLKKMVETQVESNPTIEFRMVFPGSQIPDWFRYQNEGSSLKIIRPPGSCYNKNNLVGYVFCCVFDVQKQRPAGTYLFDAAMDWHGRRYFIGFDDKLIDPLCQPLSDHLWLRYFPIQLLKISSWSPDSRFEVLSFERRDRPSEFKVRRCGVHPVFVDEIEEFNEKTKEWRRSKVWNINESDFRVPVPPTMDVATTSKRSLPEHSGVETSASDKQPFKELK